MNQVNTGGERFIVSKEDEDTVDPTSLLGSGDPMPHIPLNPELLAKNLGQIFISFIFRTTREPITEDNEGEIFEVAGILNKLEYSEKVIDFRNRAQLQIDFLTLPGNVFRLVKMGIENLLYLQELDIHGSDGKEPFLSPATGFRLEKITGEGFHGKSIQAKMVLCSI